MNLNGPLYARARRRTTPKYEHVNAQLIFIIEIKSVQDYFALFPGIARSSLELHRRPVQCIFFNIAANMFPDLWLAEVFWASELITLVIGETDEEPMLRPIKRYKYLDSQHRLLRLGSTLQIFKSKIINTVRVELWSQIKWIDWNHFSNFCTKILKWE